ncbi:putative interactor of constitutive active ROPs [Rosa chinensis]|uniref:Putative interactor of constitutive active ROPs n=1 Tax=Rosa chinensis TaxID=74649 RepID=A0A2P6RM05_ROSCH|nr:putative interactor of constitutive active ROPs [Rosa chinensis]
MFFKFETELRRLKVQSNQWRKTAEAATVIFSTGNNGKFVDRTGSHDNHYNPLSSPYSEDLDDDSQETC